MKSIKPILGILELLNRTHNFFIKLFIVDVFLKDVNVRSIKKMYTQKVSNIF